MMSKSLVKTILNPFIILAFVFIVAELFKFSIVTFDNNPFNSLYAISLIVLTVSIFYYCFLKKSK